MRTQGTADLTFVDLFAGAGGMSLGFIQAGFRDLFAADADPVAVATYRANISPVAVEQSLDEAAVLSATSVIIGGPPCQGFSSAGLRRSGDHRNSLVRVFAELIASNRPTAFVFENVEGFLTAEGGARVFDLLDPLIDAGYQIHLRKINAANFGVPQHRKRVLAIGGFGFVPQFPTPTHSAFGAPGARLPASELPRCPTLGDAIAGLPEPAHDPPGEPQGHFVAPMSEADQRRIALLKPGQTMRDLPEELQHESYPRRANRRVMDGTPTERRGGAPAGIRRLKADQPSKAITGAARNEFIHPTADRALTIRECARIQTFPDAFAFAGSASDQMRHIGNAVPPVLAHCVAIALRNSLLRGTEPSTTIGRLLSFVPTRSNGTSPALKAVISNVADRYGPSHQVAGLPLWP